MNDDFMRVKAICDMGDKDSSSDTLDITYILSREELMVYQNHICSKIYLPTTIIQFCKKGETWDRIDSQLSSITLRSSCHTFRVCAKDGEQKCIQCDAVHAELFAGISQQNQQNEVSRRLKKSIGTLRKTYTSDHYSPQIGCCRGRNYIVYNCPMLGYLEHVFPIFVEGTAIGTLIVGQIKLDEKAFSELVQRAKKSYFEKHPDVFNDYIEKAKRKESVQEKYLSPEQIIQQIIRKSGRMNKARYSPVVPMNENMYNPSYPDKLTREQYDETIIRIVTEIETLEKTLSDLIVNKRKQFVQRKVADAIADFYCDEEIRDNLITGNSFNNMHFMWQSVSNVLDKIVPSCGVEAIYVYSSDSPTQEKSDKLRLVAQCYNPQSAIRFNLGNVEGIPISSFSNLPKRPITSAEYPAVLGALFDTRKYIDYSFMALLVPTTKNLTASVYVLFVSRNSKASITFQDALIGSLINFFALISSRISEMFELASQEYLDRVLRMYKHEIRHLTANVAVPIRYLKKSKLRLIDDKKLRDVYLDAEGTLNMLSFMSSNIGVLLSEPVQPTLTTFPINQKLLYKWENTFREGARSKAVEFCFSKSRIDITSDIRYAELVVYNLFSNAVKYSYEGSKIYFNCRQMNDGNGPTVLSIVNYASNIPSEYREEIFSFGKRYEGPHSDNTDGSGIGLYIVDYIMTNVLHGSVELASVKKVSDFNIPMLYAYMKNQKNIDIHDTTYQKAMAEYERLRALRWKSIVADPLYGEGSEYVDGIDLVVSDILRWGEVTPDENDVKDMLFDETYEICFEVIF